MTFGLRSVLSVPAHGSSLDWWVEGRVGARPVRRKVGSGGALRCGSALAVVVGAAGRVA